MNCKYCKSPLELDTHVLDDYRWWCANCHACFNDAGRPQPNMYIYTRVTNEHGTAFHHELALLEQVAAAAVRVFTPSEVGLMFMPSGLTKGELKQAVQALLAAGWQPPEKDISGT